MKAIDALDAHDGRAGRPQHAHLIQRQVGEALTQAGSPAGRLFQSWALDDDVGQHRVGRVMHPLAILHFLFHKAPEVMLGRVLDGVVLRVIALHQNVAGQLPSSGAARDLRKQLKHPLSRAEIG